MSLGTRSPASIKMAGGEEESEEEINDEQSRCWKTPLDLFNENKVVKICAPMVRYSKLPFRMLVRKYDCDIAYTPMIISESFVKSAKARDSEFTTNSADRPLIVQFAANTGKDLADAAELVAPYADGVDLNCGCPQRWAMQEHYGAYLIKHPELIKDMIRQTTSRLTGFPVSIKIRIHDDPRQTVNLCRQAEHCGVSWIAVHGRTTKQRNEPVNLDVVKLVNDSVSVPVVANGDIRSMDDVQVVQHYTGVNGVMAARGILNNPALYCGYDDTPLQCVKDWMNISLSMGTPFSTFHHHLIYMLEKITSKAERRIFNSLKSTAAVLDYLSQTFGVEG